MLYTACLHGSNLFCQVCLQQLSSASPWVWFGASPQSYAFNVWSIGRAEHFEFSYFRFSFLLGLLYFKWSSSFLFEQCWRNERSQRICVRVCYILLPCFCSLVCRHFVAFLRLMFSNRNRGHRSESKLQPTSETKEKTAKSFGKRGILRIFVYLLFTPFRWSFLSFSVVTRGRTLLYLGPSLFAHGFCFMFLPFTDSAFFILLLTQDHCVFSLSVAFSQTGMLWWVWCPGLLERPCSTLEATSLPYSRLIRTNVLHRFAMSQQTRDLSVFFLLGQICLSSRLVRWRVLSSTWWGAPGRMQFLCICRTAPSLSFIRSPPGPPYRCIP